MGIRLDTLREPFDNIRSSGSVAPNRLSFIHAFHKINRINRLQPIIDT